MKLRLSFCILFVGCVTLVVFATNNPHDTLSQTCSCQTDCCIKILLGDSMVVAKDLHSRTMLDSLSYITTLINALNNAIDIQSNNIACITVIIGIIGLLIAFAGFYEFNKLTDNVREYKKRIDNEMKESKNEIQNKINEFGKLQENVSHVNNKQNLQNRYIQKINQYLFSITNSIIDNNQKESKKSSTIRESLYHDYHIINLFLPPTDKTLDSFNYLKAKGTIDDIPDLEFIATNAPDESTKRLAIETIGFIKGRGM